MKTRPPDTSAASLPISKQSVEKKQTPPGVAVSNAPASPNVFDATTRRSGALEGTSHGYTAPTQVESPFTPEERQVLSKKIPCPALAGLFNAGMLKVEKDGTVQIPDLERALSQIGPSTTVRKVLTDGADKTDDVPGSFNLFKLNGSNLDHTGSSGIRQDGVHPERFELMKTFSKDGQRLTASDLADAGERFVRDEPGFKGRVTNLAEMTIVLDVFGRRDADGTRFFTFEDAKQLFVDGQIPSSWQPPAVPGVVGLGDILGGTAMKLFRQFVNGQ